MNSKDLWLRLYDMETTDIKIEIVAMIMFLANNRDFDLKDFIKDIKRIFKERG